MTSKKAKGDDGLFDTKKNIEKEKLFFERLQEVLNQSGKNPGFYVSSQVKFGKDNSAELILSPAFIDIIKKSHAEELSKVQSQMGLEKIILVAGDVHRNPYIKEIPIVKTEEQKPYDVNPLIIRLNESKQHLNEKRRLDKFIVTKNNQFAYSIVEQILGGAQQYQTIFFLYSGAGLGKTHLLEGLCWSKLKEAENSIDIISKKKIPPQEDLYKASQKIWYTLAGDLMRDITAPFKKGGVDAKDISDAFVDKMTSLDLLVIDDIQTLSFGGEKKYTMESFKTIVDNLSNKGKWIVLASDQPLSKLNFPERLSSRIGSGLVADILPPDLETKTYVFYTKLKSFGTVPSELIEGIEKDSLINGELSGILFDISNYRGIDSLLADITLPFVNAKRQAIALPDLGKSIMAASQRYRTSISGKKIEDAAKSILEHGCAFTGHKENISEFLRDKNNKTIAIKNLCMVLTKYHTKISLSDIENLYKTKSGTLTESEKFLKSYGLDLSKSVDPGQSPVALFAAFYTELTRKLNNGK